VIPRSLKNPYQRFGEGIASIFHRPKDESRIFSRDGSVDYMIARRYIPETVSQKAYKFCHHLLLP
jgi:hypothetical protein